MNVYQALQIAAQHDAYQSQVLLAAVSVLVALYGGVGIFSCLFRIDDIYDTSVRDLPVSREAAYALAVIKSAFWPIVACVWLSLAVVKGCLTFMRGIDDLIQDRVDRRTKRRESIPKMTARKP